MRPYIAIIKDSFRAAMASRVLYVLLLLITLLLVALAPLHMRETLDWELKREANIKYPDRLLRRIVERRDSVSDPGIVRIWEMLPEKTRGKMLEIMERPEGEGLEDPDVPGSSPKVIEDIHTYEELISELNIIIEDPTFYRAEDWNNRNLPDEATALIGQGVDGLSDIRIKRLNRLLIATAVTPTIDSGNSTALDFYYAIWRIPINVSVTHQQFAQTLTSELPVYFDKFVMSIGLLIAILVTANMVPETFEPGSLNLLLSKPISRWGLYTAKFVGGCVFIALCAGYLFLGVWVWLGLAMEVWDRAILLSIPLYVIVFAIYFSVSAFVGLLWRSAIVSVILTLIFWAFCFTIGSVYGFVNTKMTNSEFIDLLPVGDQVLAADLLHQVNSWDQPENAWEKQIEAELGEQGSIAFGINSYFIPLRNVPAFPGLENFLAPIYDQQNSRIFTSRYEFGQFMSSGKKKLFVADADSLKFREVGRFPRDTVKIFVTKNGVVAATSDGDFFRLVEDRFQQAYDGAVVLEKPAAVTTDGDSGESVEKSATAKSEENESPIEKAKDDKENSAQPKPAEPLDLFQRIGPRNPVSIRSAERVDYSITRDEFVVYQNGTIKIYRAVDDGYQQHASLELDLGFDKNMTTQLAFAGDTILLAFGNGKIITVDAAQLAERNEYQPESRSAIQQVGGSPSGRYFLVLYRNGNLWMLDTESPGQMRQASVIGQGEISTFAFAENDQLWVSDNTDRATEYDLSTGSKEIRLSPTGGWIERAYRLVLRPFYKVCPKPGEFYKVVTHLSSSGDTTENADVDLNKTLQASDPWSPLWSGLVFMLAMLGLGCLVFQFKDY